MFSSKSYSMDISKEELKEMIQKSLDKNFQRISCSDLDMDPWIKKYEQSKHDREPLLEPSTRELMTFRIDVLDSRYSTVELIFEYFKEDHYIILRACYTHTLIDGWQKKHDDVVSGGANIRLFWTSVAEILERVMAVNEMDLVWITYKEQPDSVKQSRNDVSNPEFILHKVGQRINALGEDE